MKELRQETRDRHSAKDAGAVPDHHGFIAAFEKQYAQMRERRAFSEAQRMRREKHQHEASVTSVVRGALKARRTRISAMLEQHTVAEVR
mmetsp:Transcript_13583/g.24108  ORF Transcript_13583/g.24108 Transcript_13583/m.24108 type:complete len:89 (+) Transcript_13583:1715-1981(+)